MTTPKSTKTFSVCRIGLPILLACLTLPAAAVSPTEKGWALLQQNQNSAARAAFQAALKQNPTDVSAFCGLGQVELLENKEAAALKAWRQIYHLAPSQWAATAYWPQMASLAPETGRWDLLEGAAHEVLSANNTSTALRASADLALAQAADRRGQAAAASKLWDSLAYIRRWQVIGPFDNASQSGFDKAYSPEHEVALDKAYPGKDDQALRWHGLSLVGRDGQCLVGLSLGDREENVFYAVTAVQSAREQSVQLQFDPTGASKIFVNGKPIFADPIKRSHTSLLADPFSVSANLQAGWNTILIKLSDDKNLGAAFALRVTTASGVVLPGLVVNPKMAKGFGEAPASVSPAPFAAPLETAYVHDLRRQPVTTETSAMLGENLGLARDYQASAEAIRAGLTASPDCGWLHWELAQTLEDDEQTDDSHAERDLARKQNPRLIDAALDALSDDEDVVSPTELITRARGVLALNPASPNTLWFLSHAYTKAKLNSEALKSAKQATAAAPGTASQVRLMRLEADQEKRADAVAALTVALRAAPADTALLDARAGMLSDQDDDAAAIPVYQRLIALDPTDTSSTVDLAKLYEAVKQPAAALRELRLARAQRPQDADRVADLADLLQEMGKNSEAVALYSEAIRLDPSQLTLRDKRAILSGEKPVLDLAPALDGAPILASAAHLKEEGSSAVMLLDEGRAVVYPDFATLVRYHQIIKVMDQSAAQRYQSYPLARDTSTSEATVESARLIKADGKVQDDTEEAESDRVSFPSLSPGDVIDVIYRVEDFKRGGLAHQFWQQWSFNSGDAISKLSRYVLITPPGMEFQTRNHGDIPAPTIKNAGSWRIREWRMTDVPGRKPEVMGTGFTDASTWLDISTVSSWAQIVQWYQDLSRPRCVPDTAIRAKALELTKNAVTEQDKIHALQGFVAREVQYQSSPFRLSAYVPTEGKQVLRERYGDCKDKAALLTAMLAAVGIQSDMVLLSGRGHGLTPYLPSPRFNHAIARVQTAQGPLWVDATADQLAFGALPPDDQQVPALIINDATKDLTLTPELPAERNFSTDIYTGTLEESGTLRGSMVWNMTGSQAWLARAGWKAVPGNRQEEGMRILAGDVIKNAVFDGGGFDNLAEIDSPLNLHMKYHVDHFSTPAGKFLLLPLPWSNDNQDKISAALLAEPLRTQDLELADDRTINHSVVRLTFPPGYVPQELPPDVQQKEAFGSFVISYVLKDGVLEVTRDLNLTALRLPAKEVAHYAAFLQAASQASDRQIVLKKP